MSRQRVNAAASTKTHDFNDKPADVDRSNNGDGMTGMGRSDSADYIPLIHNPRTKHFEFMGPHGTALAIVGLPLTVAGLYVVCGKDSCPPIGGWPSLARLMPVWSEWVDPAAAAVIAAWFAIHMLLNMVLPGDWVYGVKLRTGGRLGYRINGFNALVTCIGVGVVCSWIDPTGTFTRLVWIADHFIGLATAASALATILSLALYLASFRTPGRVLLSEGGNSRYPLYDFWMGRELNPRIFGESIDLKYMCELRPGLIGWIVLDLAFAAKQVAVHGHMTNSMMAVIAFQSYYVVDALWNERAILTTMDITTDGFGFMLAFGDLVWVPFTYSLQARYLSMFAVDLSVPMLVLIILLNLTGLWIFRGANGEKNAFRTDPMSPSVRHLQYITTASGRRLLTSGWWGTARKINYTGDWFMALAWCLPCGFASPIPYFYAVYFAVLLVHRAGRDEELCRAKYGSDWDVYRKRVPYVFIPGVY